MIEREFERALRAATDRYGEGADLLPTCVATALQAVLPVDGASISIGSEAYRLPLGASNDESTQAERLQFTAGDGPCLTALENGSVVTANAQRVRERWPELADLWFSQTRFRSAVSHPLMRRAGVNVALNLFFEAENGNTKLDTADLAAVSELAGQQLVDAFGPELVDAPSPLAKQRQELWVMLGLAMSRWQLNAADALARLRSLAYAQELTLDDLAGRVVGNPDALDD